MNDKIFIKTKGHYDFIKLNKHLKLFIEKQKITRKDNGIIVIFAKGTTCALTIMELENGTKKDLIEYFEKIAPEKGRYHHFHDWQDYNGAAHLKASLIKPDLTIPILDGKLDLGKWQSVVLIDFDDKPREREIIIKYIK